MIEKGVAPLATLRLRWFRGLIARHKAHRNVTRTGGLRVVMVPLRESSCKPSPIADFCLSPHTPFFLLLHPTPLVLCSCFLGALTFAFVTVQ